uniref:Uncharacterized protein n=1 Tax=Adineta vaga TaxID=104782 RepID=G3KGU8_ADIVA|nr:hypothetical protein [Adineta vaga]
MVQIFYWRSHFCSTELKKGSVLSMFGFLELLTQMEAFGLPQNVFGGFRKAPLFFQSIMFYKSAKYNSIYSDTCIHSNEFELDSPLVLLTFYIIDSFELFCYVLVESTNISRSGQWQKLKSTVNNYNLFPSIPPATDQHELQNQRISTKLFIILLAAALVVLLLYTSLIDNTQTVNIKSPTLQQYSNLHSTYPQTLTCTCSQISINYVKFIHIDYAFHQICTSVFISQEWIQYLFNVKESSGWNSDDFREMSPFLFQALFTFCELVNQTIRNRLLQFYSSEFVTASVIPSETVQIQAESFINQFISTMTNDFLLSLLIVRQMTQGNALYSAQDTNIYFYRYYLSDYYGTSYTYAYHGCSCVTSMKCAYQAAMYDNYNGGSTFYIPGMKTGCYIVEALLQSDLQCFYNQTCLNQIELYFDQTPSMNVTTLDPSLLIQFIVNSTIQQILDKMMVEEWNTSIIYEDYYKECHPSECTYINQTKNTAIYIVTTIIGLIGGLMTILKIITPRLVTFIRRKQPARIPEIVRSRERIFFCSIFTLYIFTFIILTETPVQQSRSNIGKKLKDRVLNLSMFPSVPPTNDEHELQNQRISTRLFILLLVISLTVLLLYNSLINITQTVNIKSPTLQQYSNLYSTYPQTLTCACSQISINYVKFIHIDYAFHQICTSVFISQEWINYLFSVAYGYDYSYEFLSISPFIFQGLAAFCDLVKQGIGNRLIQFHSKQFVSASVVSSVTVQIQAESFINQFISAMTNDLLISLLTVRQMTQSNSLLSGQLTNYGLDLYSRPGYATPYAYTYDNCNCGTSMKCAYQARIYDYYYGRSTFYIPGMKTGCYIVEALLQSDLQCFYNQTCLNKLHSYIDLSQSMNITTLNESSLSSFKRNSTIEDILNELMVEEWNTSVIFEDYYKECQPLQCTYSRQSKNSIIYIVTTIIGLIGGLVTVLKLLVPRLVNVSRRKIRNTELETRISIRAQIRIVNNKLKDFFVDFNLFPSIAPATDQHELQNQRISTKLFIILLAAALVVLLLYTSLIDNTQTVNIKSPTLQQYSNLHSTYPQTLTCTCSQISINYVKFIHIDYAFHQICTSVFISQEWIQYLFNGRGTGFIRAYDFRGTIPFTFQALSTFCELVNQTIRNRLLQFYSSEFVTASVIPSETVQIQAESFINQFISTMTNDFLLSLLMIEQTSQSNALLSAKLTNYGIYIYDGYSHLYPYTYWYDNCSCVIAARCGYDARVHEYHGSSEVLVTPGMISGCYIVGSLLDTDFRCFYNQTCISKFQSFLDGTSPMNVTTLDPSLLIQFIVNSTVEQILNKMMVEEWNTSIIYEDYYKECHPSECTYINQTKNTAIYIVTTIIGLIGGLMMMLRLLVPLSVTHIMRCIRQWKNRHNRVTPMVES